ncbi:MAG: AAA family ATPase [Spirochaetales bacterium]|nr:AAA family ATPase [Spirochaetales bacterium]
MPNTADLKDGERVVATILFSDMKGFTTLSERMDPEEMDALMGRVFGAFEESIRAHGGMVEKYIGDALVAVFGVTELHEDDSARAIHAALDFLGRLDRLAPKGVELSFRTGIHTGLAATGRRGEHDVVTGHAMSVAQRLEAAARPDSILVSDAVAEKCRDEFQFGEALELRLKGKSETVKAWPVIGLADGVPRDDGPLHGRREQLDELLRAYLRTDPKEGAGFIVTGEAGIGKSRLMASFVAKLRAFPDFASPVLSVRARRYRSRPYAAIVDLVLARLGLAPDSGAEETSAALGRQAGIEPRWISAFTRLVERSDAEGFEASPRERDPEASQALLALLQTLLDPHDRDIFPPLAVIDDAHALDPLSTEFLAYWIRNARVKPFAVLLARESTQSLRDSFPAFRALRIGPLAEGDSRALLMEAWPECPERLIPGLLQAGMGNPLFLREYAAWGRKHRDVTALPPGIQSIFLSRVERYPEAWRDLLLKLSVFMHSFDRESAEVIERRTGGDPDMVAQAFARFTADGVLVEEGGRCRFRLDPFKKALYASLLNHNKKILHGLVADIMLSRERPDAIRLLGHLGRSERFPEAAGLILADPDRNYRVEYLEHLDVLHRALARRDADLAVRVLITKSAILFNTGRIEEAEEELRRIMRIAIARKDDACMGFAYHQICAYNTISCQFQKAVFTAQKALRYYRAAGGRERSVQNVLRHAALAEMLRGNAGEANRLVAQALAVEGGDAFESATARAEILLLSGDYAAALALIDRALAEVEGERAARRAVALDLKLKALWQLCDWTAMTPVARELLAAGSPSDSVASQAHAMLALALHAAGSVVEAEESFRQAEFFADRVRNDFDRIDALRTLAVCRAIAGERRKAESTAREGLVTGLRHSAYWQTFTLLTIMAESKLARDRADEARYFLLEASYLFTSGTLLPAKDAILYYHLASRLLDPSSSAAHRSVAFRLLEDEKARIRDPELVAAFLSTRSFAAVQRDLDAEATAEVRAPEEPSA